MSKESNLEKKVGRRSFLRSGLKGLGAIFVAGSAVGAIDEFANNAGGRVGLLEEMGMAVYENDNPSNFIYGYSPFERYAEIEEEILNDLGLPESEFPRPVKTAKAVGDEIAMRVAKRVLKEAGTHDIRSAIPNFDRARYMTIVAEEIDGAGIIAYNEDLISKAFDPRIHGEGVYGHLDCDLLSYLMIHIGRKHNVAMHAVPGYEHTYLTVDVPGKNGVYVVEATKFRDGRIQRAIEIERRKKGLFRGKPTNECIGSGFFSTFEKQKRHGVSWVDPDFEKAAKLHKPIKDPKEIEDEMVASILAGLADYADNKGDFGLRCAVYNRLREWAAKGTDSYLVISNLFTGSLEIGQELIKRKKFLEADELIRYANLLRSDKGPLILETKPIETITEGMLYLARGKEGDAKSKFSEARNVYIKKGYRQGNRACDGHHASLLVYSAAADMKSGWFSRSKVIKEFLKPAMDFYKQVEASDLKGCDEYNLMNNLIDQLERQSYSRRW